MPTPGPECPYCRSRAELRDASLVYGERFEGRFSLWVCAKYPECDSYVGIHKNRPTPDPLGTMAGPRLRGLRKRCHASFDQLWKGPGAPMKRKAAYKLMAEIMGRNRTEAHIASMNEDDCMRLLAVLHERTEAGRLQRA